MQAAIRSVGIRLGNVRCAAAIPARFMSDGSFKAMIMLKRKDGDWWLNTHKPLALQLPKIRKYAINIVNAEEDEETMYDGVAELWFDKEEDLFAAYDTEAGKAVATDSLAVVSKRDRLLTTEYVD
eukprot:gene8237-9779_t